MQAVMCVLLAAMLVFVFAGYCQHVHPVVHRLRPPVVGVLGCMAERLKERLFSAKSVDIVAGPDALRSVPDLIDLFIQVGPL